MNAQRSFNALTQPLRGIHAIEASAGTGKTYSITLLWLRLLVEYRMRVDQVLVTTFTRAATAELQERLLASLRRALEAAKGAHSDADCPEATLIANAQRQRWNRNLVNELETALSAFDLAPIYTIHGFCQSLISRHTLELGCDPGLELSSGADEILEELVGDRLMHDAITHQLSHKAALEVVKEAISNPLGRLLEPITENQVNAQSHALLNPFLKRVRELKLPTRTLNAIVNKIEACRDKGSAATFSEPQSEGLASILDELITTMTAVSALHRALGVAVLHPFAALAREQFALRKSAANLRTFDDILLTVHSALSAQGDESPLTRTIRERFKAAIVDECQDSDGIQIDVFRRLFSKVDSFVVIGDPKQSIYRFRGADLSSYQRLSAGATRAPDMTTNYRSDRPLVEALNALYAKHPSFRGGTKEHPIRYVEVNAEATEPRLEDARTADPLVLLWTKENSRSFAKRELAQKTAMEFRRLLDERVTLIDRITKEARPLKASDLAVLATKHSDLELVRRELLALRIPCEQAGESLGSVWLSDEAVDVQAWLEAVAALEARTSPLVSMLAFAATPLFGRSATEIEALRDDPLGQAVLAQQLLSDAEHLRYNGPLPLLQRYWRCTERISPRLGSRSGERRMTNWRHIGCLLQAEWATGRCRASELSLWLARKRGQDGNDDGTLMKLETDLPAVQLVTVFSAKGLEYPVVC